MMKSKQKIIDDGQHADRFLKAPDFMRFMREIEESCWSDFKETEPSDKDGREAIYSKMRGVDAVITHLRVMVENGAIEKKHK